MEIQNTFPLNKSPQNNSPTSDINLNPSFTSYDQQQSPSTKYEQ